MKTRLGLLMVLIPLGVQAQPAALERAPLRAGFTSAAFNNVNVADAQAAFLVFAQTVGQRYGYDLDTETRVYPDAVAMQADIRSGWLMLAVVEGWQSLDLDIETEMEPAFIHDNGGEVLQEFVLYVRRGSGLNALADLRGRKILVHNGASNSLSGRWLEALLREHQLGPAEAFFTRVEPVAKPSAAVLPVFFGNEPACVVNRRSFAAITEMNPQVAQHLVPLAVSESLPVSITYLARQGYTSDHARRDMLQALAELHLEPDGRQILTLFKVDRLVPFQEEYRDSLRRLQARLAESRPGPAAVSARTQGEPP